MKIHTNELLTVGQYNIIKANVMATVIERPGRWEDLFFEALQIDIEEVNTPFVMTLALPEECHRALSPFVRPADSFATIAAFINRAQLYVQVEHDDAGSDV